MDGDQASPWLGTPAIQSAFANSTSITLPHDECEPRPRPPDG